VTNHLQIQVGPELFRFDSETQWVNKAQSWFRNCGVGLNRYICIDKSGRICKHGADFMRATAEKTYPIVVYAIDQDA
jgi:hypothetical protein